MNMGGVENAGKSLTYVGSERQRRVDLSCAKCKLPAITLWMVHNDTIDYGRCGLLLCKACSDDS